MFNVQAMGFHSVLITGANRGIGLEFVRQFLENPDVIAKHVIATSRSPEQAFDLTELQKKHSKLHILKLVRNSLHSEIGFQQMISHSVRLLTTFCQSQKLELMPIKSSDTQDVMDQSPDKREAIDVTDFESLDAFASEVGKIVGEKGLTLLINNAALGNSVIAERMDTLEKIQANNFITMLVTNIAGPIMLTKALYPLLKKSAIATDLSQNSGKVASLSVTKAAVINISSIFGSNQFSGTDKAFAKYRSYGYRESKAALNMATQSLSIDLEKDGILVESIHPGTVDTRLTDRLPASEKISTETSVKGMLKVMLALKENHKNGFYQFDGAILPF